MLFEAVSKKKTFHQRKDLKELRYEQYAQALERVGLPLEDLVFPHLRQQYQEELDRVVPEKEADDFFRWLGFWRLKKTQVSWSTSNVFHHSSRMHSEKLDDVELDGTDIF